MHRFVFTHLCQGKHIVSSEEIKHLQELQKAYIKRLRILELKTAQMGGDTPPHILIEAQELRDKIADNDTLSQSIITKSDSTQKNTYTTHKSEGTQKIEVIIQGSFEQVTPEIMKAMVRALAAIMEISYDQVSVLNIRSGSIILLIEVSKQAAERLYSVYNRHDLVLDEIKVSSVKLVDGFIKEGERSYSSFGSRLSRNLNRYNMYARGDDVPSFVMFQARLYSFIGVPILVSWLMFKHYLDPVWAWVAIPILIMLLLFLILPISSALLESEKRHGPVSLPGYEIGLIIYCISIIGLPLLYWQEGVFDFEILAISVLLLPVFTFYISIVISAILIDKLTP